MAKKPAHFDVGVDLSLSRSISADELKNIVDCALREYIKAESIDIENIAINVRVKADENDEALKSRITEYFQSQIEDGNLDAEGMAGRLTRYGMMPSADFVDEMCERIHDLNEVNRQGDVPGGEG